MTSCFYRILSIMSFFALSHTPAKWFIVEDHEFHCRFIFLRFLTLSLPIHDDLENSVCLLLSRCVSTSSWRFFCARSTHKRYKKVMIFSSRSLGSLSHNFFFPWGQRTYFARLPMQFCAQTHAMRCELYACIPHRIFSLSSLPLSLHRSIDDDVKFEQNIFLIRRVWMHQLIKPNHLSMRERCD